MLNQQTHKNRYVFMHHLFHKIILHLPITSYTQVYHKLLHSNHNKTQVNKKTFIKLKVTIVHYKYQGLPSLEITMRKLCGTIATTLLQLLTKVSKQLHSRTNA